MTKQNQLDELARKLLADNPTPLLAESATQLVFGSGSPDAEIVFIGEAPGKKEDLTGEPFVGQAGKFLDEMLSSVGIERSDVYITNIVKYRPPDNRDPLPEEKTEFWPYLIEQINIIKPKIVVTLGRHSGQAFIESLHISVDHGKPRRTLLKLPNSEDVFTQVVLPLYHPAAALYNGALRQTLLDDFKIVTRLLISKI